MAKKGSEKKIHFKEMFLNAGKYIKNHWPQILVFVVVFSIASLVVYFDESTSDTVVSFKLDEFEIGQIADRNIYARKTLPPDEANPVSVEEGERVIRKGFPITEQDYKKLKKMAESPTYIDYRAFADKLIFLLLVAALWFVLFAPGLFGKKVTLKEIILESIFLLVIFAASAFGDKLGIFQGEYALPIIVPSAFCVMIISILFGRLSAVFFSILIAGSVLCTTTFSIIPTLFILASSIVAAMIVSDIERRIELVFAALLLSVSDVVLMVVLKVIFNDTFQDALFVFLGIAVNGFLSGILVLGMLTPLESILNTASTFRLMDLSDLNAPIIRHLMVQAPGTYQHSMMVAQLAENACKEIGANFLIARVGAYYHDIGKMDQPEYFTENQQGENKHDDINPTLSVSVIRSHVRHGVEKAHQVRLPKPIIDIIAEHHGNSVISYFYNEALKTNPDATPEDFSYTGTPPSTKESAVVMLADTVEAACRSLENPSVPRLEKFINQLVAAKIEHGQLDNAGLTFKDLAIAKKAFVQVLASFYHSRIKYQNQKDPDEEDKTEVPLPSPTVSEATMEKATKDAEKSKKDTDKDKKEKETEKKETEKDEK